MQCEDTARQRLVESADARRVVCHIGLRLLTDVADRSSLTRWLSARDRLAYRRAVHGPGRVLADLAEAVADGSESIYEIAVMG